MRQQLPYTAQQVMDAAWCLTGGDPTAMGRLGVHAGHPRVEDEWAMTKEQLYDAALRRDLGFFERLLDHAEHDRSFLVSRRVYIPKDRGPGQRPVDPPSELRRILSAIEARKVSDTARDQDWLAPGVIGFRAIDEVREWIDPGGDTRGLTIQDVFAAAVYRLAHSVEGGPWAVKVDLRDAFGQLPHFAIHEGLRQLRLGQVDRRRVLDLARFRTREPAGWIRTRKDIGVEQGNPLSALLMSVAMTVLLQRLAGHGVAAVVFGDDLVLHAQDEPGAHRAFDLLLQEGEALGFHNIRPLARRGSGKDEKASTIHDLTAETIPLIHTFEVGTKAIGLVDEKLQELRAALDLHTSGQTKATMIRRIARSAVISKAWMRQVGLLKEATAVTNTNSSACTPITKPAASRLWARWWKMYGGSLLPAGSGFLKGESPPILSGIEAHQVDGDDLDVGRDEVLLVGDSSRRADPVGAGDGSYRARAEDQDAGAGLSTRSVGSSDSSPTRAVSTNSAMAGATSLQRKVVGAKPSGRSGTGRSPVAGVKGGAPRVQGAPPGPVLHLQEEPLLREVLLGRRRRGLGDRAKGRTLDLRGWVGDALAGLPHEMAADAVRRVFAVARTRGKVWVIIHPGEAWTGDDGVLGGRDDGVYRCARRVDVEGGVLVKLVLRDRSERASSRAAEPSARRLGLHRWRVSLGSEAVVVEVESPVSAIGRAEALAEAARVLGLNEVVATTGKPQHVGLWRATTGTVTPRAASTTAGQPRRGRDGR